MLQQTRWANVVCVIGLLVITPSLLRSVMETPPANVALTLIIPNGLPIRNGLDVVCIGGKQVGIVENGYGTSTYTVQITPEQFAALHDGDPVWVANSACELRTHYFGRLNKSRSILYENVCYAQLHQAISDSGFWSMLPALDALIVLFPIRCTRYNQHS